MNKNTPFTANLQDKSVILFEEIFQVVRGGYYCDQVFKDQWEILEHLNLCMVEENSFIGDLSMMEREIFTTIVNIRLARQQEMEYAIKYAGIVPHVADRIELGTILCSSWGYDQTNIDYYCVVEMSKSMCKILPMYQKNTGRESGDMSEYVVASKTIKFGGELLRKKIQVSSWGNRSEYVRIASYANASLWDGKEKYQSHYH